MKIIRGCSHKLSNQAKTVLAIGNFDGLHIGHQKILEQVIKISKSKNLVPSVLSFYPHPYEVFNDKSGKLRIMSLRQKFEILEEIGIQNLFLLKFTKKFSGLSAKDFIENILIKKFNVAHVVIGDDFRFGKNAEGDVKLLKKYFDVTIITKDSKYSSTNIRKYLSEGHLSKAKALLGRNYKISGKVIHGNKDGQKIGFPTANFSVHNLFLPKLGVYAVGIKIKDSEKKLYGVANIGIRPTFGGNKKLLEVHIFDFDKNIYGKLVDVEFIEFIREEKKFENLQKLKAQIVRDVANAKNILCQ